LLSLRRKVLLESPLGETFLTLSQKKIFLEKKFKLEFKIKPRFHQKLRQRQKRLNEFLTSRGGRKRYSRVIYFIRKIRHFSEAHQLRATLTAGIKHQKSASSTDRTVSPRRHRRIFYCSRVPHRTKRAMLSKLRHTLQRHNAAADFILTPSTTTKIVQQFASGNERRRVR
jgi:hypothetical protein